MTFERILVDSNEVMTEAANNSYFRDAVLTATPEQLQLMLYDGAIRYAMQARDALRHRDYETACDRLTRAQHVVMEMLNGLNYEANRELCERVASIYHFLFRRLVDACVQRDVQAVDDALKVLRIERETWQMLVEKVSPLRANASAPHDGPAGRETQALSATTFAAEA